MFWAVNRASTTGRYCFFLVLGRSSTTGLYSFFLVLGRSSTTGLYSFFLVLGRSSTTGLYCFIVLGRSAGQAQQAGTVSSLCWTGSAGQARQAGTVSYAGQVKHNRPVLFLPCAGQVSRSSTTGRYCFFLVLGRSAGQAQQAGTVSSLCWTGQQVKHNRPVLFHCAGQVSRSSTTGRYCFFLVQYTC